MAVKAKRKAQSTPGGARARDMRTARRTAGVNVIVSIGVAAALLILVNFISGKHNLRADIETIGRYGLSASAKRILDEIDQKVVLTSVYTSTSEDKRPEDYLPRVRDLLREIAEHKDNVTVVNVASDRHKAAVLTRLRQRLDEKAKDHLVVLKDFQLLASRQVPQYEQMANRWKAYPTKSWLTQFGLAKSIEGELSNNQKKLSKTAAAMRAELSGSSLPDYPDMVGEVKSALEYVRGRLEGIGNSLRKIAAVPEHAEKSGKDLTAKAAALIAAVTKVVDLAGKPGSPPPGDPSALLDALAKAATGVADAAQDAQTALTALDNDSGRFLRYAETWVVDRASLPVHCRQLAAIAGNLTEQASGIRAAAKVEVQKQFIQQVRPGMPQLLARAQTVEKGVADLLTELTRLDQPTKDIFAAARKDEYLQPQSRPVGDLLKRVEDLGELEDQDELIDRINQDNVVLAEVGEKTGVVGFEEVWPLARRPEPGSFNLDERAESRRVFNGDMAISTKLLGMATDPLGEVVLTYFEEIPPPFMRQQRPSVSGPIPSVLLRTLRERLEKANLKVTEWNLAREPDPPEPEKDRRQVLLVLPPPEPMPMPGMGGRELPQWKDDEHTVKIKRLVEDGTPAIFLASYFRPMRWGQMVSPPYMLGDYLRDEWSLDARTSLRVVRAEPDVVNPGTYELPVVQWTFMPLSTFTSHPIGEPLKARRLYWLDVCPVVRTQDATGDVVVEDVLVVPKGQTGCWAASDAQRLENKLYLGEGSGIVPGSAEGDLMPPFAVAVHASRTVGEKTARIVVLGVGLSYIDQFLNSRVPRIKGGETLISEPPSTGDVDLVINSVYHLIDRGEFIGAGPALLQPISIVSSRTMGAVKVLFGLVWPLIVLAVGGAVMVVRKR